MGPAVRCAKANGMVVFPPMTDLPELHVVHDEHSGEWHVGPARDAPAISTHEDATAAQRAARRLALEGGARRIHLHDRYRRVHTVPVTPG